MVFKVGDKVEINNIGKKYITESYDYEYRDFFNKILIIMAYIDGYYCLIADNNNMRLWVNDNHFELSKKYYRKEKLKQLKNGI